MHARRNDLFEVLAVIQARPEFAGQDIITMARFRTGPGDLRQYVQQRVGQLEHQSSIDAVTACLRAINARNGQIAA